MLNMSQKYTGRIAYIDEGKESKLEKKNPSGIYKVIAKHHLSTIQTSLFYQALPVQTQVCFSDKLRLLPTVL